MLKLKGDFEARGLSFYRDENLTKEVPMAEVRRGEAEGFFVTPAYHVAHCAHLFQKLHRATKRGKKVDGLITALHHTDHCVNMLFDTFSALPTNPQWAFTKWPYCGRTGWIQRGMGKARPMDRLE